MRRRRGSHSSGIKHMLLQSCAENKSRGASCKAPHGPLWAPCKAPTSKEHSRTFFLKDICFSPDKTVYRETMTSFKTALLYQC